MSQLVLILVAAAGASGDGPRITALRPLPAQVPLASAGRPVAEIVFGAESRSAARTLQREIKELCGVTLPLVIHSDADIAGAQRHRIVLGNLVTNKVAEHLYLNLYTYEDRYFPGDDGFVIRCLIDPLGNGYHVIVVGGSHRAGVEAGVGRLAKMISIDARRGAAWLSPVLEVRPGKTFEGLQTFPWRSTAGRGELHLASKYLRSGDLQFAREYREAMLAKCANSDDLSASHLLFYYPTMSWEQMEPSGVFTSEERLKITGGLLTAMRGDQGYKYLEPYTRPSYVGVAGNHATRGAMGFYFGYRFFAKYYAHQLARGELARWKKVLADFWGKQFRAYRNLDEAYSQHGLGGSLDNTLTVAFCLPDLARGFFERGVARKMGEYCIVQCNNLGGCPRSGDVGGGDYPLSPFMKLAYRYNDGRYLFMARQRRDRWTSSDEPYRGFATDLEPTPPSDHVGVHVVSPVEPLYLAWAKDFRGNRSKTFDKLAFRDGFHADDAYLLVDGVGGGSHAYADQNTIAEFSQNSRVWLCQPDAFVRPTLGAHNAVTYSRDGLGPIVKPAYAELVALAQSRHFVYSQTALPGYGDMDWTRHILHERGGSFLILDELRVRRAGTYTFAQHFRGIGEERLFPGKLEMLQDEGREALERFDPRTLKAHVRQSSGGQIEESTHVVPHLSWAASKVGDFVEIEIVPRHAGPHSIELAFRTGTPFAIVRVGLDEAVVVDRLDLFGPLWYGIVRRTVGPFSMQAGKPRVLRVEIVGKNAAASGYHVGLVDVCLSKPAPPGMETNHNGFHLHFPADVNASLRDDPAVGRYLTPARYCDNVVHELRLSHSRRMKPTETATLAALFYAWTGASAPDYSFKKVGEGVVMINSPHGLALAGAGLADGVVSAGELKAEAGFLHLTTDRLFLVRGRSITCAGKRVFLADSLSDVEVDTPSSLRHTVARELERVWNRRAAEERQARTASAPAWASAAKLRAIPGPSIPGTLSMSVLREAGRAKELIVGTETGAVRAFDPKGVPLASCRTRGEVHAIAASDTDADGVEEVLVGTDHGLLLVMTADLHEIRETQLPYRAKGWSWYTLMGPKVRAILPADLDHDGRAEVLLGMGDGGVQAVDHRGELLWYQPTRYGTPVALATCPVPGDREDQLLAGIGIQSSTAECFVFSRDGCSLGQVRADGYGTGFTAILVVDLDHDGRPSLFCGTSGDVVRTFDLAGGRRFQRKWFANMGGEVRDLAVVGRPSSKEDLLVVASASGSLVAFREDGEKVWVVSLSDAIAKMTPVGAPRATLVAGLCDDGRVFVVDGDGAIVGRGQSRGQPIDVVWLDGHGLVVVATSQGLTFLQGDVLSPPRAPQAKRRATTPFGLPAPAFSNLVRNGGFEADDPTKLAWKLSSDPVPVFDKEVVQAGKRSLRSTGANIGNQWPAYQTVRVKPNTRYGVGAWVRTKGLGTKGCGLLMAIQATPKGLDYPRAEYLRFGPSPDFRLLLREFVSGPEAVSVNVYCRLSMVPPTATVWFDDVFLYEVEGGPKTVGASFQLTADWVPSRRVVEAEVDTSHLEHYYRQAELRCRITIVEEASGRTVRRAILAQVRSGRQKLSLNVGNLGDGSYLLKAVLLSQDGEELHRAEEDLELTRLGRPASESAR